MQATRDMLMKFEESASPVSRPTSGSGYSALQVGCPAEVGNRQLVDVTV